MKVAYFSRLMSNSEVSSATSMFLTGSIPKICRKGKHCHHIMMDLKWEIGALEVRNPGPKERSWLFQRFSQVRSSKGAYVGK